jgi:hypothetical protein
VAFFGPQEKVPGTYSGAAQAGRLDPPEIPGSVVDSSKSMRDAFPSATFQAAPGSIFRSQGDALG